MVSNAHSTGRLSWRTSGWLVDHSGGYVEVFAGSDIEVLCLLHRFDLRLLFLDLALRIFKLTTKSIQVVAFGRLILGRVNFLLEISKDVSSRRSSVLSAFGCWRIFNDVFFVEGDVLKLFGEVLLHSNRRLLRSGGWRGGDSMRVVLKMERLCVVKIFKGRICIHVHKIIG